MLPLLLPAIAAFVVSPLATSSPVLVPCHSLHARPITPMMGFFDDLKKGFENDERLIKSKPDPNAGLSKNAPGYVKKKVQQRNTYEKNAPGSGKKEDTPATGNRTMKEIFSGWKW